MRRRLALAISIITLIAGGLAVYFSPLMLSYRGAGTIEQQWKKLSRLVPTDRVVGLEWLQFPDWHSRPGYYWLQVNYLDENDNAKSIALLDQYSLGTAINLGISPRAVTHEDLTSLEDFTKSQVSCAEEEYSGVSMTFLPDGERYLSAGCGTAYNTSLRSSHVIQVAGEDYPVSSKDFLDQFGRAVRMTKHFQPDGIGMIRMNSLSNDMSHYFEIFGKPTPNCNNVLHIPMQPNHDRRGVTYPPTINCHDDPPYTGPFLDPDKLDVDQLVEAMRKVAADTGFLDGFALNVLVIPTDDQTWQIETNLYGAFNRTYNMDGVRIQ